MPAGSCASILLFGRMEHLHLRHGARTTLPDLESSRHASQLGQRITQNVQTLLSVTLSPQDSIDPHYASVAPDNISAVSVVYRLEPVLAQNEPVLLIRNRVEKHSRADFACV